MNYLSLKDVLNIHSTLIEETGGSHGIRDIGLVESAISAPQASFYGKDQYESVFNKAAVYLHRIAMNHPFVDGNKRTAITSAGVFLSDNGYKIKVKKGMIEKFVIKVVKQHLEIAEISNWLEDTSIKIQ